MNYRQKVHAWLKAHPQFEVDDLFHLAYRVVNRRQPGTIESGKIDWSIGMWKSYSKVPGFVVSYLRPR